MRTTQSCPVGDPYSAQTGSQSLEPLQQLEHGRETDEVGTTKLSNISARPFGQAPAGDDGNDLILARPERFELPTAGFVVLPTRFWSGDFEPPIVSPYPVASNDICRYFRNVHHPDPVGAFVGMVTGVLIPAGRVDRGGLTQTHRSPEDPRRFTQRLPEIHEVSMRALIPRF